MVTKLPFQTRGHYTRIALLGRYYQLKILIMSYNFFALLGLLQLYLCLSVSTEQNIRVVAFKDDFVPVKEGRKDIRVSEGLLSTPDVSVCVRLLPRYKRPYIPIATDQIRLYIQGLDTQMGFIEFYNQPSVNSSGRSYSRMFTFCQPRVPGKWMSLCFSMKLKTDSQQITIVQNGRLCQNKTYFDGGFDPMYYKKSRSLQE